MVLPSVLELFSASWYTRFTKNVSPLYYSELMYELRQIQHGSRPVTGQDNRQNVNDFFSRALQQNSSDVIPPGFEPPRPENVIVEVNALVERRPVSNILQSAGFRQSLENAVRGAISRVSSPAASRNTTQATASASLSGAAALSGVNSNLVHSSSSLPQAAEGKSCCFDFKKK